MGDLKRVFEVGPVFRAEKSQTHRHLTEFTGLDVEMEIIEHYDELMDLLGEMFLFIFENLESRFAKELDCVQQQFPT